MGLVLAFWVFALATTLLSLATVPRLRTRMPRRFPRVSVIVPARDEERTIERTVRALLAQTYPDLELIVVNDRSVDRTGEILAQFGEVIVVHGEEPPPGWLGKPWALHQGSARATGEWLLFVDADVIYHPDAIAAAVAHLETREQTALLSLLPDIEMRGFWEHAVMPNLAVFAYTFLPLWAVNHTRLRMLAVGGGPGNLVRRADYEAAGGHESLKDAVVDDVGLARLLRRSGRRTEVVRAEKYVSVRMYHGLREIVGGFTKNAFAVFGYNYFVALLFLVMAVGLHLLPYALAATGHTLALLVVAAIALTRLALFLSIGYRIDNALFGHPFMIGTWLWILARSIWFTGIRRQVHWRGRTYDAGRTRFGAD
jgi:chlorobactene glucosyltransferase